MTIGSAGVGVGFQPVNVSFTSPRRCQRLQQGVSLFGLGSGLDLTSV